MRMQVGGILVSHRDPDKIPLINPFILIALFLYPLKTENREVF